MLIHLPFISSIPQPSHDASQTLINVHLSTLHLCGQYPFLPFPIPFLLYQASKLTSLPPSPLPQTYTNRRPLLCPPLPVSDKGDEQVVIAYVTSLIIFLRREVQVLI